MATFLAIGDPSNPGEPVDTLFINLDDISRVKYSNPVSHSDSDDQTVEVTFSDGKTFKFGARIARVVADYIGERVLDPEVHAQPRKKKG